jgi:LysM repeat protein
VVGVEYDDWTQPLPAPRTPAAAQARARAAATSVAATAAGAAAAAPAGPAAGAQANRVYVTRPGDVLSNIATRNNTTVETLLNLNPYLRNRRDYIIWENDKIKLP